MWSSDMKEAKKIWKNECVNKKSILTFQIVYENVMQKNSNLIAFVITEYLLILLDNYHHYIEIFHD